MKDLANKGVSDEKHQIIIEGALNDAGVMEAMKSDATGPAPTEEAAAAPQGFWLQPVAPSQEHCPVAQSLGGSPAFQLTLEVGKYYHLNVSVRGAAPGRETNVMIKGNGASILFDGSAFVYDAPPTVSDGGQCQVCTETAGDFWLFDLPFTGLEVVEPPCPTAQKMGFSEFPDGSILIYSVNGIEEPGVAGPPYPTAPQPAAPQAPAATPATPAANEPSFPDITPGRVGQGEA
jgi:hypothetical protein